MKTGIVYMATNKITNKSYIGLTTVDLKNRIRQHYYDSKKYNNHFPRALCKYKKSDWMWKVLYKDIPVDMLGIAEQCAIYTYDTFDNGYNSTLGGESAMCGRKHTKETKRKISKGLSGKVRSEKTKTKISKTQSGRKLSEETKRKISEAKKAYHLKTKAE